MPKKSEAYRPKGRRMDAPRPRLISTLTPQQRQQTVVDMGDNGRPKTRGECPVERPCPWVSCRYHLAYDVYGATGSIKANHPGLAVWEMASTCALDEADRGGMTFQELGDALNLTQAAALRLVNLATARVREAVEAGEVEGFSILAAAMAPESASDDSDDY